MGDADLEALRAARASGRGALAVTPHFGNWEFGALAIGEAFEDVSVIVRTTGDAVVDAHIRRCRGRNTLLDVKSGLRAAWRALERGGIVCVAIDEPRSDGIDVDFLGGRHRFPTPLFRMAERTKAAIIPVRCGRDARGRVAVATFPEAHDAHDVARVFSEWIRSDPAQWSMLGRIATP